MTGSVYLHGFASSPASNQGDVLSACFAELGLPSDPATGRGKLRDPYHQRPTASYRSRGWGTARNADGSSLGGYLAALYAARYPSIERVVLMAPAFHFPKRWRQRFPGDELAQWKRSGSRKFFHYAFNEERPLGTDLSKTRTAMRTNRISNSPD